MKRRRIYTDSRFYFVLKKQLCIEIKISILTKIKLFSFFVSDSL
jgi:hypothetical protein